MSARLRALLHLRSERGQTSAEYLGIVVFVVAVIAALYALAPGIGDSLAEKVREQVSAIATPGDGSGAGGPVPAGGEPVGGGQDGEEEQDEPNIFERGVGALGDAAGAVGGGIGDLASGAGDLASGGLDLGGDLLSGAGDLLSGAPGFVVVGDVRDSLFNLGKVIVTGGQDGKADLGLSLFGIVPYFGDVAKGGKLSLIHI